MALLGGVRSPFGAALGTALLILLPESLRFLKVTYLAVYGGAVILLMVFMPEGIWGFLETLRGFPMRVSDSSVGGDAGQFHTTRWTLVFHTLPTPKTRRFNASWSPFHSTPNLSSDWIQLWWVHVPSSPKKEDDQCETTAPMADYFQAANAHKTDAVVAAFAEDALVTDENREHRGAAIKEWSDEVNENTSRTPRSPTSPKLVTRRLSPLTSAAASRKSGPTPLQLPTQGRQDCRATSSSRFPHRLEQTLMSPDEDEKDAALFAAPIR
jgi:hypothetical protein